MSHLTLALGTIVLAYIIQCGGCGPCPPHNATQKPSGPISIGPEPQRPGYLTCTSTVIGQGRLYATTSTDPINVGSHMLLDNNNVPVWLLRGSSTVPDLNQFSGRYVQAGGCLVGPVNNIGFMEVKWVSVIQ